MPHKGKHEYCSIFIHSFSKTLSGRVSENGQFEDVVAQMWPQKSVCFHSQRRTTEFQCRHFAITLAPLRLGSPEGWADE